MTVIRWGICGTGRIAQKFVADLRFVPGATVTAVGSRTRAAAEAFASGLSDMRTHDSYESLAADDGVDVVYVATPQSRHCEDVLSFLQAGKHVLCEKPFAMTAAESRQMVDAAKTAGRFLMEAMWTRFLPLYVELRRLLADGAIGTPHLVSADFGFRVEPGAPHRLLDRSLGGGSLLDVGVYPVSLASMVLGAPSQVVALATNDHDAGVDAQTGAVLTYDSGGMAVLHSSILGDTPGAASIAGPAGRIAIDRHFHGGRAMTLTSRAGTTQISRPFDGVGLWFQVIEVMDRIREGHLESDVMPWQESVAVMTVLDEIRRQTGHS